MQLAGQPALATAFHAAISFIHQPSTRLTGCAVWAKVCHAELDQGQQRLTTCLPVSPEDPHPYCRISAAAGVFDIVYTEIAVIFEVRGLSRIFQHPPQNNVSCVLQWSDSCLHCKRTVIVYRTWYIPSIVSACARLLQQPFQLVSNEQQLPSCAYRMCSGKPSVKQQAQTQRPAA